MRKKIKALVVDDDNMFLSLMKTFLPKIDIEPIIATDGPTALELIKREKDIDLIFLDLAMPLMDGAETLKHIRNNHPNVPVIFISGRTNVVMEQQESTEDKIYYMAKPFLLKTLTRKIEKVLGINISF